MLISAVNLSSVPVDLGPSLTTTTKVQAVSAVNNATTDSYSSSNNSAAQSDTSLTSANNGTSSAAVSSSVAGASAGAGSSSGAGVGLSLSEMQMLVGSYSTSIHGTQYAGSVADLNGTYTATVPGLEGATASGTSMIQAENNLTLRVNELV